MGYAVYTYKADNVIVAHNIFHDNLQYGFSTGGELTDYSNNLTIANNRIYNCGEVGIKLRHCSNSMVEGNTIDVSWARGTSDPTGIRLYSFDGDNKNIVITNNTIKAPVSNAVAISSDDYRNVGIQITKNHITNAGSAGILIKFNNGTITGNSVTYQRTCIADRGSGNRVSDNSCTLV
jgi:parallel beta-helix repeat protein